LLGGPFGGVARAAQHLIASPALVKAASAQKFLVIGNSQPSSAAACARRGVGFMRFQIGHRRGHQHQPARHLGARGHGQQQALHIAMPVDGHRG
jgi:hypothetical protein